jgi:glutamate-1-semialdehyde 2,1-aminomutase
MSAGPLSQQAFERARGLFPGGVNSPARACRSVGTDPVFVRRGHGARVEDLDGCSYIDYVCGFGPMILGHAHPAVLEAMQRTMVDGLSFGIPTEIESELGALVAAAVPSIERLRLVSSGTEATMAALRLARGATGRSLIVKFEGCYHGHADHLLVKAGSGAMTLGAPDSAGVPAAIANATLVAPYNDGPALEALFAAHGNDIAAVIIEPVVGNMGVVVPERAWLDALRALTRSHGALLVFDEVMTGFRVAWGGAQALFGVEPDITCLGKVIGGGMPIGAYGGSSKLMATVAPEGPVYQAGTNSGNPVSVAAGLATLRELSRPGTYERLEVLGALLEAGLVAAFAETGVPATVQRVGSMLTPFFTNVAGAPVRRLEDIPSTAPARFGAFFRGMRARGVMLPPSQYEAWFISLAHDEGDIDATIAAARATLAEMAGG